MGDWTPEQSQFFDHAGQLVAQIETMLDEAEREGGGARGARQLAPAGRQHAAGAARRRADPLALRAARGRCRRGDRLADFFRGVAGQKTTTAVRNALSVGTDTAGGYSVPSPVMPSILEALAPVSSLLHGRRRYRASGDGAKTMTTAAINALPTAAWRAENGSVSESDPTFRAVTATPRSLAFMFRCRASCSPTAGTSSRRCETAIAQAFARAGSRARGPARQRHGAGTRGVLNVAGIQSVTNSANGAGGPPRRTPT